MGFHIDQLNERGQERYRLLRREIPQGIYCQRCRENGSVWDDGTRSELFGDHVRKQLTGESPPFDCMATCIVWQEDVRVMINFSHLEPSCDYHVRYRPYLRDECFIERAVIWRLPAPKPKPPQPEPQSVKSEPVNAFSHKQKAAAGTAIAATATGIAFAWWLLRT